jgi:hypothetical protein
MFGRRRPGQAARPAAARRAAAPSNEMDFISQFQESPLPPQGYQQPMRYEQPVAASRYSRPGSSASTEMTRRGDMQGPVVSRYAKQHRAAAQNDSDAWAGSRDATDSSAYGQAQHHMTAQPAVQLQQPGRPVARTRQGPGAVAAVTDSSSDVKELREQLSRLQEDMDSVRTTLTEWEKIWKEIADAIYEEVGSVDVDNLPYYEALPSKTTELQSPAGRLKAGTEVQLKFPQYKSCKLLFQRMTVVDPKNGSIKSYYLPLRNISMRDKNVEDELGLSDGTKKIFVTNFRATGIDA